MGIANLKAKLKCAGVRADLKIPGIGCECREIQLGGHSVTGLRYGIELKVIGIISFGKASRRKLGLVLVLGCRGIILAITVCEGGYRNEIGNCLAAIERILHPGAPHRESPIEPGFCENVVPAQNNISHLEIANTPLCSNAVQSGVHCKVRVGVDDEFPAMTFIREV